VASYIVGEISEMCGMASTCVKERPIGDLQFSKWAKRGKMKMGTVNVDDLCDVVFTFENGGQVSLSTSRLVLGRKKYFALEINGTKGSVLFDWERRNDVLFYSNDVPDAKEALHG
jgi:predicted dehydrogenase